MTAITVPISITIKAGKREERIEKEIEIKDIENLIDSLGQEVSGKTLMTIINNLEDEIQQSVPRSWRNVGREPRRAVFSHGHISYHRRVYRDEQGQRHKPLDELLGIQPYERSSQKVQEMGSVLAAQTSYRMAANSLSYMLKTAISPSSIQRMVWRTGGRIARQEEAWRSTHAGTVAARVLYAESDGVWIHLQRERHKRQEARVAVMYTGKKRVGKQRFRLENKVVMTQLCGQTLDWQVKLRELADQSYDLEQTELMAVGGDGNSWVRQSFDLLNLPQAHLLDRYHVMRALRQSYGHTLNVSQLSRCLFNEGFEAVAQELTACIRQARGKPKQRMLQTFNYLKNNQDALVDLDKRGLGHSHFQSLGSIEGNVDKLAVHRMKGHGCCWRLAGAEAMLAILRHKDELQRHGFVYQPVIQPVREVSRVKSPQLQQTYQLPGGGMPIFHDRDLNEPWVRMLKSKIDFGISLTGFF
ncbi:MAG: ISLre2 family transposase [Anaerolineales bacterium]|nr:ISLre2 family transposase [Anaerolineales bacterium]